MKVLVTGGSGFLGAWITRLLISKGYEVRVFDMNPNRQLLQDIVGPKSCELDWYLGDVSKTADVAAAAKGCQAAVHLAGILTPDCRNNPVRAAEINLIGTLNVFEAGLQNGLQRVVYCSTAGVYGPHDGQTPRPTTHYGAFKLAAEGSARAYWEDHGFASVGFRPYVIYGPGRETGATAGPSLACRAAARGEAYTIPYVGTAGYVYVEEVAAAFEAAVSSQLPGAHVFNLAGETATVEEVIAEIHRQVPEAQLKAAGAPLPIAGVIAPDNFYDIFPAVQRTTLAHGIAATIAHYRTES